MNPFIFLVGIGQLAGGIYAFTFQRDWKMGVLNVCVGIANAILSTMNGKA